MCYDDFICWKKHNDLNSECFLTPVYPLTWFQHTRGSCETLFSSLFPQGFGWREVAVYITWFLTVCLEIQFCYASTTEKNQSTWLQAPSEKTDLSHVKERKSRTGTISNIWLSTANSHSPSVSASPLPLSASLHLSLTTEDHVHFCLWMKKYN